MCTASAAGRARGFTLPELLLLVVVLAIGLGGIVTVYVTTVAGSADPLVRKQAMAIAESFMEEIMLQAYAEPVGSPAHTTRDTFDSVDDYNTPPYSTAGIQDVAGNPVPGLANYNVAVTVDAPTVLNGAQAKLVTVTVTGPGVTFTLQGYRASY
jgi:MSHA pilin protein MshD